MDTVGPMGNVTGRATVTLPGMGSPNRKCDLGTSSFSTSKSDSLGPTDTFQGEQATSPCVHRQREATAQRRPVSAFTVHHRLSTNWSP